MEKRALVEIDREGTAAAKPEKRLDIERAEHIASLDRSRSEHNEAQTTIGHLRGQTGRRSQRVYLIYELDITHYIVEFIGRGICPQGSTFECTAPLPQPVHA
jgi:hypothetical protein